MAPPLSAVENVIAAAAGITAESGAERAKTSAQHECELSSGIVARDNRQKDLHVISGQICKRV